MSKIILGIAGGSGCGKTTLINEISARFKDKPISIISHDSYYYDLSYLTPEQKENRNFDHPDALETDLLEKHIKELKEDKIVEIPQYDFITHSRKNEKRVIYPQKIIIVEGLFVLYDPRIIPLLDIKLFVDIDADERFIRRLQRDVLMRGRTLESVIKQYICIVKPMHNAFIEPSKKNADIIIPEGGLNRTAVDFLVTKLEKIIS